MDIGRLVPYTYFVIILSYFPRRIHGAAIYGNIDPINIPHLCYTSTMDPMGLVIPTGRFLVDVP